MKAKYKHVRCLLMTILKLSQIHFESKIQVQTINTKMIQNDGFKLVIYLGSVFFITFFNKEVEKYYFIHIFKPK